MSDRRVFLGPRIRVLRAVLDLLWNQTQADGGEPSRTIGRAKVELIHLERELYALTRRQREAAWLLSQAPPGDGES